MRFRLFLNILVLVIIPVILGTLAGVWTRMTLASSDARGAYWFNGVTIRAVFMGLLVATIAGVIGGYIVRVVVPKHFGRPVQ